MRRRADGERDGLILWRGPERTLINAEEIALLNIPAAGVGGPDYDAAHDTQQVGIVDYVAFLASP